jgi:hypothetical protein
MGLLRALEARLSDPDVSDKSGDGYYVRTKDGRKVGPMVGARWPLFSHPSPMSRANLSPKHRTDRVSPAEYQFRNLQKSEDTAEIASAWRMAGGNYYKVELSRGVVFDRACSCKACGHVCELLIIIVCFLSIVGVFIFLINSKVMEKERKKTGEGTWFLLEFMLGLTVVMVIYTIRTLFKRWRKVSTDVFASEV